MYLLCKQLFVFDLFITVSGITDVHKRTLFLVKNNFTDNTDPNPLFCVLYSSDSLIFF